MKRTLSQEILANEEFLEFDIEISGEEIIRRASCNSDVATFWKGPLGDLLRAGEFIAPFTLIDNGSELSFHQRLVPTTYPAEWTGRMLARAGIAVLDLLTNADYQTLRLNESYSRNFQIFAGEPKWVDLGSFSSQAEGAGGTNSFQELQFLKNYVIPTYLRLQGKPLQAASLLNVHTLTSMGATEAMRLSPVFHLRALASLGGKLKESIALAILAPLWLERTPTPLQRSRAISKLFSLFTKLIARPLLASRVRRYRSILDKGSKLNAATDWAAYGGRIEKSTPRFEFVQQKIAEIAPSTVVDIGGNRGYVGLNALARNEFESYTVLDWDETAIDALNDVARQRGLEQVVGVKYNFANPWTDSQSIPAAVRFSADLVVCLALSHHLLLTSQMSFARMWKSLAMFAKSDLLIEFMPKGLWSKSGAGYETPSWYTEKAFIESSKSQFSMVSRHELEENRVLFHLRRR